MAAGLPGRSEQAGAPDDPRDSIRLAAVAVAAALQTTPDGAGPCISPA